MKESENTGRKILSVVDIQYRFDIILSNLPFPSFISDHTDNIVAYNNIFITLVKDNPEFSSDKDNSRDLFVNDKVIKLKYRGKQKFYEHLKKPLQGFETYFLTILQDVTGRQKVLEEYEELHRQHEILMKVAPSGIFYVDATRKITFWNKRAEEITGFSSKEVVGRECMFVSGHPCDKKCRLFEKSENHVDYYSTETVIRTKNGSGKIVSKNAMIIRDRNGNPLGAVESIYDLTDLIKANTHAHESELKFRSISASAQDGIIMINDEGNITFWNKAAERIFGYKKDDVLNFKLHDMLAPERYRDKYRTGMKVFKNSGTGSAVGKTLELLAVGSDGMEFPIELSLSSVRINKQWHAIGIVRDITFKKIREKDMNRLIEELSYSQQAVEEHSFMLNDLTLKMIDSEKKLIESNATKDKFFSILAHDLKNPLASFRGVLNMLLKDFDEIPAEEVKSILSEINSSSENLQQLLDNILQWSRSQRNLIEYNPENINIHDLIKINCELLEDNLREKSITFSNNIDPDTFVYADMNMLNTVIRNILSNSIKFTPDKGKIIVSAIPEGSRLSIIISDNGIGMSDDIMECLFKPGMTRSMNGTNNEKGTGLGLLLCKEFIDKQKGKIEVRSEVGTGTDFILTLPIETK